MNNISLAFPRELILKKNADFNYLYREGKKIQGETVTLFFHSCAEEPFRVGFSTRKKMGNAVQRNRARRLMREVFRIHQHELRRRVTYIFLWTGVVKEFNYKDVEKEMLDLLKRGKLLQGT